MHTGFQNVAKTHLKRVSESILNGVDHDRDDDDDDNDDDDDDDDDDEPDENQRNTW